jgi:DNA (cytosine-5)-methyltransferase 1
MFPADYKWPDQNSANDKMVGNAVPVGLSKYVAECLLAYLLKGDDFLPMCFTEWLQKRKHIRVAAAGDNLSRYRRVKRFLIGIEYDDKDILKILDKSKEFIRLSPSVRSQLKRACELHIEYEAYLNNLQRKVVGHA